MVNLKNLALGVGIIIVFALVLWQGIETFYPSPKYENFCNQTQWNYPSKAIPPNVQCNVSNQLSNLEQQCYAQKGQPIFTFDENGCASGIKECDMCQVELEKATSTHSQKVFYISAIVGILAFIIGFTILSIEPVGSSLMFAGIWSLFWGTVVNWANLATIWRFLLLLVALVILIAIAIKINKRISDSSSRPVNKKRR